MATSPDCLDAAHVSPPTVLGTTAEHSERSRSHPSLRRDKPQLSCNLCRKRKVRCDRQNPCGTCTRRGFARSCAYSTDIDAQENGLPRPAGTLHERIHQLESLVISLMQRDTMTPAGVTTGSISISESPNGFAQEQVALPNDYLELGEFALQSPIVTAFSSVKSTSLASAMDVGANANVSSAPIDDGCMKFNSLGAAKYIGSSHWAAVLDSIAELKEHFEQEEEICTRVADFNPYDSAHSTWPQILYGFHDQRVTKEEILASIPPRRAADRLVSRYFTLDIASGIFHSGQFLREYEIFWQDPFAAPIMWVGLLFTIMCIGELHQHSPAPIGHTPQMPTPNPLLPSFVDAFRERIVQCLMIGKYTKGGPYVLECLVQYYMIEHFVRQDAEFDIWILLGMLIPISLRMGLHKDPKHFSEITAFAGEMRRRVWATIFQIDVGFSALAGLPRMIKPQQCDTEEPRNLLDSDFDENTLEIPQSRPESEVTPILFLLAKNRIISVGGIISDLAHDIRPYPYTELTRVEKLLQDTRKALPSSLQWQPLSQSIIEGPKVIMQRAYLEIFFYKMQITLYKKYLSISMTNSKYNYAREVCLDSAVKILKYQQLLEEEAQLDGGLSLIRWTYSSIINHDFMLAASILCFYIKQYKGNDKDFIDNETFQKIRSLLSASREIWLRSSTTSKEAQKAVQSLSIILGLQHLGEVEEVVNHSYDGSADFVARLNGPATWPTYQDYLASSDLPPFGLDATIDSYRASPLDNGSSAMLDSLPFECSK